MDKNEKIKAKNWNELKAKIMKKSLHDTVKQNNSRKRTTIQYCKT